MTARHKRDEAQPGSSARHGGSDELADVGQIACAPAQCDQLSYLLCRQHDGRLVAKFFFQLAVGHRPAEIADGMLHDLSDALAIGELDLYAHRVFGHARVRRRDYFLAHRSDVRIVHGLIGELEQARFAAYEADGRRMENGELAFEAYADVLLVAQIEHERCDTQAHCRDILRLD